jgi:hypothetical protein
MVAFVKFLVCRRVGRIGPFGVVFYPNSNRLTISENPFSIAGQVFPRKHSGGVTGVERKMSRTTFYPCRQVAGHQMLHSPRDNADSALVSGPI